MTPFELIARKQRVGEEYAADVELWVLCYFDAAKRRALPVHGYNFISYHLTLAQYIFARLKSAQYLALVQQAGMAWQKAGARPTDQADLTTTEYTAMRAGLRAYFRALPKIEAGTYRQACNVADQLFK